MIKRLFDILIAGTSLVALAPFLFLLVILVRFFLGKPVFFVQERPGLNGRPFPLVKLRTLKNLYDHRGDPLPDKERLTRLGQLLRSTSLDELPELWNVLKGHMSLVGPRPLLMEYLPLYSPEQFHRHDVRPGITGWAQVNGRNAISWEEKFDLDLWYVNHRSFWLDLKIILLTVKKVLIREGIRGHGEATMSRFTGSNERDRP